MLRAASKLLLRAQRTTTSGASSRPWYRDSIRSCSSSSISPFLADKSLIEQDTFFTSDHNAVFNQAVVDPASTQHDGSPSKVRNAGQNVVSVPVHVEGAADIVTTESGVQVVMTEDAQTIPEVDEEVVLATETGDVHVVGQLLQVAPIETENGVAENVSQVVVEGDTGVEPASVIHLRANIQPLAESAEGFAMIVPVNEGVSGVDGKVTLESVQPEGFGIVAEGVTNVPRAETEVDAKLVAGTGIIHQLGAEVNNPHELQPVRPNDGTEAVLGTVEAKHAPASVETAEENEEEVEVELGLEAAAREPCKRARVDGSIDPILMLPKATKMLQELGLYKFVRSPRPKINKQWCNEFLESYVHGFHNGYGTVHCKMVSITPEAVHRATGLPLGVEPMQRQKTQGKLVSALGTRVHRNVYDLKSVKLSENEEENQVLLAIADVLTKKMGLFALGPGKVAARVLWGVHESWHGNTEVQWASYMAELIRRKAERINTVNKSSKYGGWLTAVIRHGLRDAGSDEELRKVKLEQLEQRERVLYAKEKEIQERERMIRVLEAKAKQSEKLKKKVRKHIARFNRFAKSVRNIVE